MADISMCQNNDCPIRLSCYRYMAMPNPYGQSYASFNIQDNQCSFFMAVLPEYIHMMKKYHEEQINGETK